MGKTIYAQLREEYNDKNILPMSQTQLAKKLGVSKATVSRYENGTSTPKASVMKKYCKIFNVSMEYLTNTPRTNKTFSNEILQSYGITRDTFKTFKLMKERSTSIENLSSLANAFMGNQEETVSFFSQLFSYAISENNEITDTLMLSNLKNYLNHIVRPQLQRSIKIAHDFEISKNDMCNLTNEDFEELQEFFYDSHSKKEGSC